VASSLPPESTPTTTGPLRGREGAEKLIFILELRQKLRA
jgi:hypothetical protein